MYQKYHTDAIVLGSYESGEADRTIVLFTQDFGLIYARATSVRSEKSKMRYAVQHYSFASTSLIKGKKGWRLAGATARSIPATSGSCMSAFARIAELTVRLVNGEDKNSYLFDVLTEAHRALFSKDVAATPTIEIVSVARILYALGYISTEALQTTLFSHTLYGDEHLQEAEVMKETMLRSINRAIAETQL